MARKKKNNGDSNNGGTPMTSSNPSDNDSKNSGDSEDINKSLPLTPDGFDPRQAIGQTIKDGKMQPTPEQVAEYNAMRIERKNPEAQEAATPAAPVPTPAAAPEAKADNTSKDSQSTPAQTPAPVMQESRLRYYSAKAVGKTLDAAAWAGCRIYDIGDFFSQWGEYNRAKKRATALKVASKDALYARMTVDDVFVGALPAGRNTVLEMVDTKPLENLAMLSDQNFDAFHVLYKAMNTIYEAMGKNLDGFRKTVPVTGEQGAQILMNYLAAQDGSMRTVNENMRNLLQLFSENKEASLTQLREELQHRVDIAQALEERVQQIKNAAEEKKKDAEKKVGRYEKARAEMEEDIDKELKLADEEFRLISAKFRPKRSRFIGYVSAAVFTLAALYIGTRSTPADLAEKEKQVKEMAAQTQELGARVDALQKGNVEIERRYKVEMDKVDEMTQEKDILQNQIAQLRTQAKNETTSQGDAGKRLAEVRGQLEQEQAERKKSAARIKELEQKVTGTGDTKTTTEYTAMQKRAEAAEKKAGGLETEVQKLRANAKAGNFNEQDLNDARNDGFDDGIKAGRIVSEFYREMIRSLATYSENKTDYMYDETSVFNIHKQFPFSEFEKMYRDITPDQEKLEKLSELKRYMTKIGFKVEEKTTLYEVAQKLNQAFREEKAGKPEEKWFKEIRVYRNNSLSQKAQ